MSEHGFKKGLLCLIIFVQIYTRARIDVVVGVEVEVEVEVGRLDGTGR